MKDIEIIKEVKRPTLDIEVDIQIPKTLKVKHNLKKVEKYIKELNKFYDNIVNVDVDFASDERTKINALSTQITELRKEKVKEFKEPIDDFEKTAKSIEKSLKELSEKMGVVIKEAAEEAKKNKHLEVVKPIIDNLIKMSFMNGYLINEKDIEINNRWYNKTFKKADIEKEINEQVSMIQHGIDTQRKDLKVINDTIDMVDVNKQLNRELYIERYQFTKDLGSILDDIKRDAGKLIVDNSSQLSNIFNSNSIPVTNTINNVFDTTEKQTIAFKGTREQIEIVKQFAIQNGMEVV